MKLYLIRHGESEANRIGKIQGCQDFPLSSLGKEQASKLGDHMSSITLDYLYSSDLTRAYETAKAIEARQPVSANKWDRIREVGLGPFEGKTKDEIYGLYPEMRSLPLLTSGIKGTETIEQLTERCRYVCDQLLRAHDRHQVALVSHGGFISILIMFIMLGEEWSQHHRPFQIDNTGITLIDWQHGQKPMIEYINRNTHLLDLEEHYRKSI
ncbi:histidine phosphatase family protein [Anaerobacillus sp. MEB173]|uniref:histidine phosphatase family protein n=1 Tax=Anaerobacillus sp. MEB173 TaxID=3383345 RepID=UPI003F929253